MAKHFRIPFTQLNYEAWKRLVITAICAFYLLHIGYGIIKGNFLPDFGGDYLAFWSAGKIADEKGYAFIYDAEEQRKTQMAELEAYDALSGASLRPAPILPIFVIPFQYLSRLNSRSGYLLWTVINLAALIGYLVFFQRKIRGENQTSASVKNILFLTLISFPVFANFVQGQVKVLLVICMGEFLRAALSKKPLPAGAWLGGLLLNPQLLILIIPSLFLLRNWKVLCGFAVTSIGVLGGSLLLSGFEGMSSMANLWTNNMPGMSPQTMMNWRMLGLQLNYYFNSSFGWVISGIGVIFTLLLCIKILRHKAPLGSAEWVVAVAGIMAATCAVTWHSNIPMAMVLIPFLIFLFERKLFSDKLVFFWVCLTPLVFIAEYMLGFIILTGVLPDNLVFTSLMGISGLILNLLLTVAVFRRLKAIQPVDQTSPASI